MTVDDLKRLAEEEAGRRSHSDRIPLAAQCEVDDECD